MSPKIFISYSWSAQSHQNKIKDWADRLISDGVEVILDIYDFKEGHDKFAFMEKMVSDDTVSHVLVFCDEQYSEKANARIAGVGTESQIISKEVYQKVDQSKFIPIICEFKDDGSPYLPIFLESRKWIDFSSFELVNKNWESLIRLLFGKPEHVKPNIGGPPSYIVNDDKAPANHIAAKFSTLKQAIFEEKKSLSLFRKDFLDECIKSADALRIRSDPKVENWGEKVLDDIIKLKPIRNYIVEWIILESSITTDIKFSEVILSFMEQLRELKSRPDDVNSWNNSWFEAHSVFVYEVFLYIIASLIKTLSFELLHEILTSHYLLPKIDCENGTNFEKFDTFSGQSESLQSVLAPNGQRLHSAPAEYIKKHADIIEIPFENIIEADLLAYLMSAIQNDCYWYPQTNCYAAYNKNFSLFLRASQHKYFSRLALITGESNADKLREKVRKHQEGNGKGGTGMFNRINFWTTLNMDELDTIK